MRTSSQLTLKLQFKLALKRGGLQDQLTFKTLPENIIYFTKCDKVRKSKILELFDNIVIRHH